MRSLRVSIPRMVSLLHILSCRMEDEYHVMLRLYYQDVQVFLYRWTIFALSCSVLQRHSFWLEMCFPAIEYHFRESANSSGMRDYLLCLWAVTGTSRIKDLLMSKSFCCKLWDDLVCFLPNWTSFMRKPKPSKLFEKYTVFREIHRFYFSFSCYAHLLECRKKPTDVKMGAVWDLWKDVKQIWGQSWLLDFPQA